MALLHNPDTLWQPFGAFSMMAIQGAGQMVHLKGQVSLDAEGEVVGPGDMRAQVHQVLSNIQTALAAIGGEMGDVVSLVHYATDIEAFMAAGDIRVGFFQPPYPITTTVEVAKLFDPRLVIEITASAEVPMARFQGPATDGMAGA
ncbi:MAG: RidA family protein [Pseudomonadota bacterium]